MYWGNNLRIPKKLKDIRFWVHPEGMVVGAIFLNMQNKNYTGSEEPIDALNQKDPFIVLKSEGNEAPKFYNKCSIIRAEYDVENGINLEGVKPFKCRLSMMDGSLIDGIVMKQLPPNNARLYDYLNADDERFAEFHIGESQLCAVNKSYIACVTPLGELKLEEIKWLEDELTTTVTIL
jgi:hypothetical protein